MRHYIAGGPSLSALSQTSGAGIPGTTSAATQSFGLARFVEPLECASIPSNLFAVASGTQNRSSAKILALFRAKSEVLRQNAPAT